MSRLNELIAELCPDGVSIQKLKDITLKISDGMHNLPKCSSEQGKYPILSAQNVNNGIVSIETNKWVEKDVFDIENKRTDVQKGDVLLTIVGAIGRTAVVSTDLKALFQRSICVIKLNTKMILPQYLKHALGTSEIQSYMQINAHGAAQKGLYLKQVGEIKLPVPPLEVQREVVRVLDRFTLFATELTTELAAEFTARKKQYEYYRNKLLKFDINVERLEIGEVCLLSAGGDVPKNAISKEKTNEYQIPIISNGIGDKGFYGYTNIYRINEPCVTVAARGAGVGYVTFRDYPFFPIIRLVSVIPSKKLNPKFLYYVMQRIKFEPTKGGIPQLTVPMISKYKIPVPNIEIQNRIVNVLDNFEAICADLNIGLPAEIEARQKQYEYYRDLLLTFAEKGDMLLTDGPIRSELSAIKLIRYVFGYSYVTLDKISENCDRQRKPVTKGKRDIGAYPYYGASGIVDYVSDYIFDGDYLLISEDGANLLARKTPIAFSISGKNWVNNHVHVLKFETYELRRYVEIYLNSIDLSKYISGGAQPKLNQENLNKIMIPLPSNERIKGIVDILDRFDALCNDLSSGLPAEIEARKKQYEYYRDKLLNFKEVK